MPMKKNVVFFCFFINISRYGPSRTFKLMLSLIFNCVSVYCLHIDHTYTFCVIWVSVNHSFLYWWHYKHVVLTNPDTQTKSVCRWLLEWPRQVTSVQYRSRDVHQCWPTPSVVINVWNALLTTKHVSNEKKTTRWEIIKIDNGCYRSYLCDTADCRGPATCPLLVINLELNLVWTIQIVT